jgi:hypothetical protein
MFLRCSSLGVAHSARRSFILPTKSAVGLKVSPLVSVPPLKGGGTDDTKYGGVVVVRGVVTPTDTHRKDQG